MEQTITPTTLSASFTMALTLVTSGKKSALQPMRILLRLWMLPTRPIPFNFREQGTRTKVTLTKDGYLRIKNTLSLETKRTKKNTDTIPKYWSWTYKIYKMRRWRAITLAPAKQLITTCTSLMTSSIWRRIEQECASYASKITRRLILKRLAFLTCTPTTMIRVTMVFGQCILTFPVEPLSPVVLNLVCLFYQPKRRQRQLTLLAPMFHCQEELSCEEDKGSEYDSKKE
mmetsp:Transcript_3375/g.5358  ORF Transcript_3375/g.5358 Transcript_3375/m.5358 type:complete len:229 (+) Transcript_3375:481-1167(+)